MFSAALHPHTIQLTRVRLIKCLLLLSDFVFRGARTPSPGSSGWMSSVRREPFPTIKFPHPFDVELRWWLMRNSNYDTGQLDPFPPLWRLVIWIWCARTAVTLMLTWKMRNRKIKSHTFLGFRPGKSQYRKIVRSCASLYLLLVALQWIFRAATKIYKLRKKTNGIPKGSRRTSNRMHVPRKTQEK